MLIKCGEIGHLDCRHAAHCLHHDVSSVGRNGPDYISKRATRFQLPEITTMRTSSRLFRVASALIYSIVIELDLIAQL